MLHAARRARGRVVAASTARHHVVGDAADGGWLDRRGVDHRVGAGRSTGRQRAGEAAAAGEGGVAAADASERKSGAERIGQRQRGRQRSVRDRRAQGVGDRVTDVDFGTRRRRRALGDIDDRPCDDGLGAGRVRRDVVVFVRRRDGRDDGNRTRVCGQHDVVEVEGQRFTRCERHRHAGERDRARGRRVVGRDDAGGNEGEVDRGRAGTRLRRVAERDAVGDAGGGLVARVAEHEAAIRAVTGQHGRRDADHRAHVDAGGRFDDFDREFRDGRFLERPQVQPLRGREVLGRAVGAVVVVVRRPAPRTVVVAAAAEVGVRRVDPDQRMVRQRLRDQAPRAAQMAIELADQRSVCRRVAAIVEVDGRGLLQRAIELGQRRATARVGFDVDHREMDLAIATDDAELVVADGERVSVVVEAVPQDRVAAAQGDAGEHAVEHVRRVEVDAVAADDDLVRERVERREREHAAARDGRGVAADVADEARAAQLRRQRRERDREGGEHAVDFARVGA